MSSRYCSLQRTVYRSAFTYWADCPPSRLDMGKDKYGGPFTNEQVEDVKTFFRLLYFLACTLLVRFVVSISFSQAFVPHFGSAQQSSYSQQPKDPIHMITADVFYSPSFFAALFIPLHELVLHPLLGDRYLPNLTTKIYNMAAILISASLAAPCTTPLEPSSPSSSLFSHSGQLTNTSIEKGMKLLMNISLLRIIITLNLSNFIHDLWLFVLLLCKDHNLTEYNNVKT